MRSPITDMWNIIFALAADYDVSIETARKIIHEAYEELYGMYAHNAYKTIALARKKLECLTQ